MSVLLLLQKIHGHIGLLAIAAALHPLLGLRGGQHLYPRARLVAMAASALMAMTFGLGWYIYPEYRVTIRPQLYALDVDLGVCFEVKEHLAWYGTCLAAAGGVLAFGAKGQLAAVLTPGVRTCLALCALCAAASAVLGLIIASSLPFAAGLQ